MLRQQMVRNGLIRLPARSLLARRLVSSDSVAASSDEAVAPKDKKSAWVFIDSIFPIQVVSWDPRHFIAELRKEEVVGEVKDVLSGTKKHDFELVSLEPRVKDGGVFVNFKYTPQDGVSDRDTLAEIQQALKDEAAKHGGIPSWVGLKSGRVWLVKGKPWREDMHRFAGPTVKVAFEGPDVHQEDLYDLFRPYGRIIDISNPTPVPAGSLRFSIVAYRNLRSATAAHNALHGFTMPSEDGMKKTRLETFYEEAIKAHAIRDWLTSHPRIVLPVVFFLIGTLTYTIFDPIRIFAVEAKMQGWFDFQQSKVVQWIRTNAIDKLYFSGSRKAGKTPEFDATGFWKDRQDAEAALRAYLSEHPTTVAFVHGPAGSGKSRMMSLLLKQSERHVLIIDCAELNQAKSETELVSGLAKQTGYWPVFSFLASMNNMIDLASVGLIGQKAGLSTSLEAQLSQVLEIVASGLKRVSSRHKDYEEGKREAVRRAERHRQEAQIISQKIKHGVWHDPRLDALVGNGIMSELGVGDEKFDYPDQLVLDEEIVKEVADKKLAETESKGDDIAAMPVIIIKNFSAKNPNTDKLLTALAEWSVMLAEGQIAHVVVMSDNRENSKRLAKALPSKPLANIGLSDADQKSALGYIQKRLADSGVKGDLTKEQKASLQRLGGRSSDLETLLHKVRNGQPVEEAVESIITSSVIELKKNAFGDDAEDAKSLPWGREQVWTVMKQLAKKDELQYYDILIDFPFKGDETALRAMEHAELIAITTHEARPATIRPGRPVYRHVFERLVRDAVFQATQDIALNEKAIASAESTIKSCEAELLTLKDLKEVSQSRWAWRRQTRNSRVKYLWMKMDEAARKVETLDAKNKELKLVLKKGPSPA